MAPQLVNISFSNLREVCKDLPFIESHSRDFEEITGIGIENFLSIIYNARATHPFSLDSSQSVIQDGTHYSLGLGLFRAILGRACHWARLSSFPSISQQQYQFIEEGYVCVEDFLEPNVYARLVAVLKNFFNGQYIDKNCINYTSFPGGPGSTFINADIPIMSSTVSDLVKQLLFLPEQKVGLKLVSHLHFANDTATRFHSDNGGITTLKWFYFPFGCHSLDSGFLFCPDSNKLSRSKMNYLHQWLHCHSLKSSTKDGLGDYSFSQASLDFECAIEARYLEHLKNSAKLSFCKPNSIVLADTSAFHCRALVRPGIKRITIQGGIDNSSCFVCPN